MLTESLGLPAETKGHAGAAAPTAPTEGSLKPIQAPHPEFLSQQIDPGNLHF